MTSLHELMTARPTTADHFELELPEGWQQGRGAFGGLVLGAMVAAMERVLGQPERRLRSLTGEIPAPAQPGPTSLRVEVLRAGNAVSTVACRMEQGGAVMAHAVGVFGQARPTEPAPAMVTSPSPKPWREVEVVDLAPPLAPVFTQHFEFRPLGDLPFSGSTKPTAQGWIRAKTMGAPSAAMAVAYADAWWPAIFAVASLPRPMATVAFTLQLFVDGATWPETPVFHRSTNLIADEGYCVEQRELWSETGTLLALNQQTIAIIK